MPFIKNISLKRKKNVVQSGITISLAATATGSSGYFTSSNSVLYTGASVNTPSDITYTVAVAGGTPPYNIQWSASLAYASGYSPGDNQSSITIPTYAGEQDTWTVRVSDATSNVSASINTIIFGDDPPSLNVSTLGSDTPEFQVNDIYGSTAMPLRTIDAAIRYAIPNETTIYVSSGNYTENPRISKSVIISGSSSPGLASGNYFIYDTVWASRPTSSLAASRIVHGFTESSFGTIGVTTSGSIQQAIYDIGAFGTVYLFAGVHIVSSSIRLNQITNNHVYIKGIHVDTGSGTFSQNMTPSTILRTPNDQTILFRAFSTPNPSATFGLYNLTLDTYPSSSYFRLDSGVQKNVWLEMIRFRTIVDGIPYDRYSKTLQITFTSEWGSRSDVNAPYQERNIRSHGLFPTFGGPIFDTTDVGFGTGRVHHGPYAPWRSSVIAGSESNIETVSNPIGFFDMASAESAVSGSRVQRARNSSNSSGLLLSNAGTTTTRPLFGINSNLYRGMAYLNFGGDGAAANDFIQSGRTAVNPFTSSIAAMLIFSPNSLSSNRGVIFKVGNHRYGFSFVMTGSNMATTFYSQDASEITTASVYMVSPVSTGSQYLAEVFFDSGSTNKRVGMALYGTDGLITSSYFSSTNYPVSEWMLSVDSTGTNTSMGCSSGYYRSVDFINNSTAGLSDYYTGTVGGIFCTNISPTTTVSNIFAHSNKERKALFDWIWMKYFPTASYVSHSLISDT